MTRRSLLCRTMPFALAAGRAAAADSARESWELLTAMASALAEGDAASFLDRFDASMPRFQDFSLAVTGLLNEVTIESSISPIQNNGDNEIRTVEVDWSMHLVDRNAAEQVTVREANVKLGLERRRGKWKVTFFEPRDLFRPPSR